jgi:hypothetical protein
VIDVMDAQVKVPGQEFFRVKAACAFYGSCKSGLVFIVTTIALLLGAGIV